MSNDNTIIVIGEIAKVYNQYDKKKRNVYFGLSAVGNNLIRSESGLVRCFGDVLDVRVGAPVKIVGKFEDDVLICKTIELAWISEDVTSKYLYAHCKTRVECENRQLKEEGKRTIKGIGKKNIDKIVSILKEKVLTLSDADLKQAILLDERFINIGPKAVEILCSARTKTDPVIKGFCDELLPYEKITIDDITKIIEICNQRQIEKPLRRLHDDPYQLLLSADVPLSAIDQYAYDYTENGKRVFTATCPERVRGYVINELRLAANEGHTYMTTKKLVSNIARRSKNSKFGVVIPPSYISMAFVTSSNLVLDKNTRTVALSKYYNAEIEVAAKLMKLNKSYQSDLKVSDEDIELVAQNLSLEFGNDQKKAFRILEGQGVNILTGGPGTGKTTVINGIVTLFKMHNPKAVVKFCAPTGKAAKQLSRSVNAKATTIHKLLNYNPFWKRNTFKDKEDVNLDKMPHDRDNPISADMIIIDECSMIEITVMNMLLDAIRPGTIVIFIGDEHQLPCIGAGNCLHDMIESGAFSVFRLVENFRQKGDGTIISNAIRINEGELPIPNDNDFIINQVSDDETGYEMLCKLMEAYYNKDNPFDVQLIEPSRVGSAGIKTMNDFVRKNIVHPNCDSLSKAPTVGDKIIVTHTEDASDYDRYLKKNEEYDYDLYINGDVGVVVYIDEFEVVVFDGVDNIHYDPSVLHHVDFANAFSIHKAQGSEANVVIIYLPESMSHMMTRALFYTAVTRAKKKVIIVYTGNALEMCVNNTSDVVRDTRLVERIQSFSDKKPAA